MSILSGLPRHPCSSLTLRRLKIAQKETLGKAHQDACLRDDCCNPYVWRFKSRRLVSRVETHLRFAVNYQVGFLCFVGLVLFLIDDLTSPIIASDMLRSDPATDAEIASSTTTRSSSSSSRPSASTASSSSSSRFASSSSSRVLTDKEKAALPTSTKPKGEEPSSETLPVGVDFHEIHQ